MKFKEIYNLEHLLAEYGMSSAGAPTPVAAQQMGASAKATAQQRNTDRVQSASPSTTQQQPAAGDQTAQPATTPAAELSKGDRFVGPEDTQLTVVSARGEINPEVPNDSPNTVVVQDDQDRLFAMEPDTEIVVPQAAQENVFLKISQLPLLEQMHILSKLDKGIIDSAWHSVQQRQHITEDRDQDRLQFILDVLEKNPDFINKLYKHLKVDLEVDDRIDFEKSLDTKNTQPEKDHRAHPDVFNTFVLALKVSDGDIDDLEKFIENYGDVDYIDTSKLLSTGKHSWQDWIQGHGDVSSEFAYSIFKRMFGLKFQALGSDRGPGEASLAVLSPSIEFAASRGDLVVDGKYVEVKAQQSTKGGRMLNNLSDFGTPQFTDFWNKYDIPEELRIENVVASATPRTRTSFYNLALEYDRISEGAGAEYLEILLSDTYVKSDNALIDDLVNSYSSMGSEEAVQKLNEIALVNYLNILKEKGFEYLLFLDGVGGSSVCFEIDNYQENLQHIKLTSVDFGDKQRGPSVQGSIPVSSAKGMSGGSDTSTRDTVAEPQDREQQITSKQRKSNRVARELEPEAPGELGRQKVESLGPQGKTIVEHSVQSVKENLRDWFGKGKKGGTGGGGWDAYNSKGERTGKCGDTKGGAKPKCLSKSKAASLRNTDADGDGKPDGKSGIARAVKRKRKQDPKKNRKGKAKNVANKKESLEYTGIPFDQCPSCGGPICHISEAEGKKDACYHKVKSRYKIWPSAYASGALVQCRKVGAKNWGKKKTTESTKPHFLKPGELSGSWRDAELRKLGFKLASNGSWYTSQANWQKLSRVGERSWRSLISESTSVHEGVPNNDGVAVLRRLLSQPLLTSDIGSQMEAYIAVPDPELIHAFRLARAEQGEDFDLREILRNYAKQLHPRVKQQLDIQ